MLVRRHNPFTLFDHPSFASGLSPSCATTESLFTPAVDILEKGNDLLMRVDLPGMVAEDVTVEVEGNKLYLQGEKKAASDESDGETFIRSERSFGKFNRTFTLPQSVDASKIDAKFKNGELEIRLPRKEESKPRKIELV